MPMLGLSGAAAVAYPLTFRMTNDKAHFVCALQHVFSFLLRIFFCRLLP